MTQSDGSRRKAQAHGDDTAGGRSARPGAAVWFTGLPGAGKSTVARAVNEELRRTGVNAVLLEMDAKRRGYNRNPTYDEAGREKAYRLFVLEAAALVEQGKLVLLDATGPRLSMRRLARGLIARFMEIHLRCPVRTAMEREAARPQGLVMAGLYAKAVKRKLTGEQFKGLGQVVGVDVPFEEDPDAELVLDAAGMDVAAMRRAVLDRLAGWWV